MRSDLRAALRAISSIDVDLALLDFVLDAARAAKAGGIAPAESKELAVSMAVEDAAVSISEISKPQLFWLIGVVETERERREDESGVATLDRRARGFFSSDICLIILLRRGL